MALSRHSWHPDLLRAPHLTSRASTSLPGSAQGSATGATSAAPSPERDTFSGSERQALEVVERGIAAAEIVGGQRHAQRRQILQLGQDRLAVVHDGAFGD